jgi:hypothetical protein
MIDRLKCYFSDKEKKGVYLEIRCNISKDQSYSLEIAPPLFLLECTVEAWYEGHRYCMEEVDYASQVEIIWVQIGGSNGSLSKSKY